MPNKGPLIDLKILQKRLFAQLNSVDQKFRPSKDLFKKSPQQYMKQWQDYVKQTEKCVQDFHDDLDYYPSTADEEAEAHLIKSQKRRTLGSARTQLSETATKVKNELSPDLPPHFLQELEEFKAKHSNYSSLFKALNTSSPRAFDDSSKNLYKDITSKVKAELKQLPYFHPATLYLKLTPEQYADLNLQAEKARIAKHQNTSSINISKVIAFVDRVYRGRHDDPDYADICIALQFATGRRRADLGLVSTLTPSKEPDHYFIDRFSKSNHEGQIHDFPALFLSVPQILELYIILRRLLDEKVFSDKKEEWEQIKLNLDTDKFDTYTKRIRNNFAQEFNIRPAEGPESEEQKLTVHNACRSVYIQFGHTLFKLRKHKKYGRMSLLEYANLMLGHTPGKLKATSHYLHVNCIDDRFEVTGHAPLLEANHTDEADPAHDTTDAKDKVAPKSAETSPGFEHKDAATQLPPNPQQPVMSGTEPGKTRGGATKPKAQAPASAPSSSRKGPSPENKKPTEPAKTAGSGKAKPEAPKADEAKKPSKPAKTGSGKAKPEALKADEAKKTAPTKRRTARETKSFLDAVRSQDTIEALLRYALKVNEPKMLDIQYTLLKKAKTIPSFSALVDISSDKAATHYLKFLKKQGIKNDIE
ncbi:MAG TPA: protelomerase family protein [Oligoflexus sp.]|uniref:protelomerase family protein n=1 Tax=Oligoflexus sp. TaxID=1971216 RepID=UPI002D7F1B52|nr:protelomerase family protein [Oligoflexus sp.]HET9239255.1 protelomerase family protein [Oligoflexus sp.]